MFSGGTFDGELHTTAERLVSIAEEQGVYFAIALLHDTGYDHADMKKLLSILEKTRGAIKNKEKNND